MHIGIDARVLMDKYYSGVSGYAYNLIKNILKIRPEYKYSLFYNSFHKAHFSVFSSSNYQNIIKRYPNKFFNYFLLNFFSWPKIDQILEKETETPLDIFWAPHINFISLSSASKKVITIHDLSFLRFPEFFSKRKNFWHKSINIIKLIRNFDIIIAISKNTKNDIVDLLNVSPDKIEVIYSGLKEEYFIDNNEKIKTKIKSKYNLPDKFILFLGNLEPRKNIVNLIISCEHLWKNKDFDFSLVIAGSYAWKYKDILKVYKKSPYHQKIKFLGYIHEEDKPYLYNLASLFVFPSFYEGFGFPPLEAMASRTPVIAGANSSLFETLGKAALFVDPYNITDLSQAILFLTKRQDLQEKFIKKGLKQAKKYSWQNTAKKYLELWENLR